MAKLRVGLTGGLASGKSTVARALGRAGFDVYDADEIVAELYLPGAPGHAALLEILGPDVLTERGDIDKASAARRIFGDDAIRRRVEAAIHPLVRRRFRELSEATDRVSVLEATKLVEAGYAPDFDLVVTVEASPEVRKQRAMARGLSAEEAQARLRAQADAATRRSAADIVIENDGSRAALLRRVRKLVAEIEARVGAPGGGA